MEVHIAFAIVPTVVLAALCAWQQVTFKRWRKESEESYKKNDNHWRENYKELKERREHSTPICFVGHHDKHPVVTAEDISLVEKQLEAKGFDQPKVLVVPWHFRSDEINTLAKARKSQ